MLSVPGYLVKKHYWEAWHFNSMNQCTESRGNQSRTMSLTGERKKGEFCPLHKPRTWDAWGTTCVLIGSPIPMPGLMHWLPHPLRGDPLLIPSQSSPPPFQPWKLTGNSRGENRQLLRVECCPPALAIRVGMSQQNGCPWGHTAAVTHDSQLCPLF